MSFLQYTDTFESHLAQSGECDASYYFMHLILGLCPKVIKGIYIQHPESFLTAKNLAKNLKLTHMMHQMHTKKEKTNTSENAQHTDIQERLYESLHQPYQIRTQNMKTCNIRQRQKTDS